MYNFDLKDDLRFYRRNCAEQGDGFSVDGDLDPEIDDEDLEDEDDSSEEADDDEPELEDDDVDD